MMKNPFSRNKAINWPQYYQEAVAQVKDSRLTDFYQRGIFTPDTPVSQIEFVALDFETTGLDHEKDDIISIGLVPFTLNRIYLREKKHWIVNPNRPLDEDSIIIHGITHNDIVDAPDLTKVLEEVLEALAGKVVVVHYKRIERFFLDTALKARIGEGILFPVVDTLEIETQVQEQQTKGLINKLKGVKPQPVRLGSSRKRYGLPVYPPHHALVDAIATAELLQAQIAHHYDYQDPISKFWV